MTLPPLNKDEALRRIVKTVAKSQETEATSFPFWGIVEQTNRTMRLIFLDGPFFSRDTATEFLRANRHRYTENAFVFAFSGSASTEWRDLYNASKGLQS